MVGVGRHNFLEIWRGVRANLPLLRGGYYVIFLLVMLIFRPPPPPPDNYCTAPKKGKDLKTGPHTPTHFFLGREYPLPKKNVTASKTKRLWPIKLDVSLFWISQGKHGGFWATWPFVAKGLYFITLLNSDGLWSPCPIVRHHEKVWPWSQLKEQSKLLHQNHS